MSVCFLNSGPESFTGATSPAGGRCPPAGEVAKPSSPGQEREKLLALLDDYAEYKNNYARNIVFSSSLGNLSKFSPIILY